MQCHQRHAVSSMHASVHNRDFLIWTLCECGRMDAKLRWQTKRAQGWRSVSASVPEIQPISLGSLSLSKSDKALAQLKANQILASTSHLEASVRAQASWEEEEHALIEAKRQMDDDVNTRIATRAAVVHETAEIKRQRSAQQDADERNRLAQRLQGYEKERGKTVNAARAASAGRARRVLREYEEEHGRLLALERSRQEEDDARLQVTHIPPMPTACEPYRPDAWHTTICTLCMHRVPFRGVPHASRMLA